MSGETPEVCHDREEEKKQKRHGSARANVRFKHVPLAKGSALDPSETDQGLAVSTRRRSDGARVHRFRTAHG